jgi:hypothetical protein
VVCVGCGAVGAVSGAVLGLVLLRDEALNVLRVGGVKGWVLWCPGGQPRVVFTGGEAPAVT